MFAGGVKARKRKPVHSAVPSLPPRNDDGLLLPFKPIEARLPDGRSRRKRDPWVYNSLTNGVSQSEIVALRAEDGEQTGLGKIHRSS